MTMQTEKLHVPYDQLKVGQIVICTNPQQYRILELNGPDDIIVECLGGRSYAYDTTIEHILEIVG